MTKIFDDKWKQWGLIDVSKKTTKIRSWRAWRPEDVIGILDFFGFLEYIFFTNLATTNLSSCSVNNMVVVMTT